MGNNIRLSVLKILQDRYPNEVNFEHEFDKKSLFLVDTVCEDLVTSNLAVKIEHPTGYGEFLTLRASALLIEKCELYGTYAKYISHSKRKTNLDYYKVKYWYWLFLFGIGFQYLIDALCS